MLLHSIFLENALNMQSALNKTVKFLVKTGKSWVKHSSFGNQKSLYSHLHPVSPESHENGNWTDEITKRRLALLYPEKTSPEIGYCRGQSRVIG